MEGEYTTAGARMGSKVVCIPATTMFAIAFGFN